MGRYSSLVAAKAEEAAAPQSSVTAMATSTPGSASEVAQETTQRKRRHIEDDVSATGKRLVVNRVENVSSSISGANSSEFDKYRRARRREQERLDAIERERREQEERSGLFARVQLNRLEADERTRRNAERRQRKKLRRTQRTATAQSLSADGEGDDGPTAEHMLESIDEAEES